MKKLILTVALTAATLLPLAAQQADQRVATLINNQDWFELIDELPTLKKSIQLPYLRLIAEAMADRYTNHKLQAADSLGLLLANYREALGTQATSLVMLRAQMLEESGHYKEAAEALNDELNRLKASGQSSATEAIKQFGKWINPLKDYPAMSVSRPREDVSIGFELKEIKPKQTEAWMKKRKRRPADSRSYQISVPVVVHGHTVPFFFDTGADRTFITEGFAREMGLPFVGDTIKLNGTSGRRAYIDSLQIGSITVRNIIVLTGTDENNKILDLIGEKAILGRDIMTALGEIQINMGDNKLCFPAEMTPLPASGINLLSNSWVKALGNREPLRLLFDTGNASNNSIYLSNTYYKAHQTYINANAVTDTISGGGYGVAAAKEMKIITNFPLSIAGRAIKTDEVLINEDDDMANGNCDGNIGMAAVLQNGKTIINYKNMFLKFEHIVK